MINCKIFVKVWTAVASASYVFRAKRNRLLVYGCLGKNTSSLTSAMKEKRSHLALFNLYVSMIP